MFKSKKKSTLLIHIDIINRNVNDVEKRLLNCYSKIIESLMEMDYSVAIARSSEIDYTISLYRKTIESYITQYVKNVFETRALLTYSIQDVEKEKNSVFTWFDEITKATRQLREKIELKDNSAISQNIDLLQKKIGFDNPLSDFVNTLRVLQTEYCFFQMREPPDKNVFHFDDMHFHTIVQKSSRSLFRDEHYAQAIFEACKSLIKYVKKKSKLEITNDIELMRKAFDVEYNRKPLKVTKKPILCLNSLSSLEEINEQVGFMHLFLGTVIGIRNPKAHATIQQKDTLKTLEYLSLISLLAERTDEAILTKTWHDNQ